MIEALDELDKLIIERSAAAPPLAYQIAFAIPLGFALAHLFHINEYLSAFLIIGALVILWAGSHYLQIRSKNRLRAYVADGSTSRDVVYNFNDSTIAVCARDFSGELGWGEIREVYKSDSFVFLFLDNAHAYIIPTRMPESEAIFAIVTSRIAESSR